jgi:2-dehydro-3-deoxygluconokinase
VALAAAVRANGGAVAFDPNYRPAGWKSAAVAKSAIRSLAATVDIALPTFEDEARLWGDATPAHTVERWLHWGAREVVVKLGAQGCVAVCAKESHSVPAEIAPLVVDTTGAGDSFNAAYLAARRAGRTVGDAASAGNRLACEVVQCSGAIAPIDRVARMVALVGLKQGRKL